MNASPSPLRPFPFDEDYSYYYSLFQEALSSPSAASWMSMSADNTSGAGAAAAAGKRKRDEEEDEAEEDVRRLIISTTKGKSVAANQLEGTADYSDQGGSPSRSQQQQQPGQRRLWVRERSSDWWDRCNHPDFPEAEFRRLFRMSRATFDVLCDRLGSAIAKEDTALRAAIPVRQRVAVCVWRLATGEPLRLVSKRFGLGISTCHKLVLEVCAAIKALLMPEAVAWPDPAAAADVARRFEGVSGIPNVVGAMYTTHIPIIAPKTNVAAYYNRRHTERNQKPSYSVTVQGVVDPDGVFTDVCIGWGGSMPDDRVLESSALYHRGNAGLLNNQWVVGGAGHPLLDWLLVPYTHQNLTWAQHAFNEKVGQVRNAAEEAFARLKARWACLQKRTEVKIEELPAVLGACCVLHNICERMKEEVPPELRYALIDDEMVAENPLRLATAVRARDSIAHNLLHHSLAGPPFL
ncbi:protein ALP1-like [Ananas comosus]|uniref:Protein ALP1-like n=1 Tax=Ananas comosus TaxID=4615 RepID=A0A6P5FVJ7_ANACO|nr:protein ALP1-like [Ananas comosus]